jgi:hypothetical protein
MRATRIRTFIALSAALVVFSFWLGFREGAHVGIMVDSVPRGGLSLFQLNEINRGVSRNMSTLLETDVDLGLLWAHQIEQHPLNPLFEPLWSLHVSEATVARLATYRAAHPSPLRSEALQAEVAMPDTPEGRAVRKELLESSQKNEQIISSMVKKYAPQSRQR